MVLSTDFVRGLRSRRGLRTVEVFINVGVSSFIGRVREITIVTVAIVDCVRLESFSSFFIFFLSGPIENESLNQDAIVTSR